GKAGQLVIDGKNALSQGDHDLSSGILKTVTGETLSLIASPAKLNNLEAQPALTSEQAQKIAEQVGFKGDLAKDQVNGYKDLLKVQDDFNKAQTETQIGHPDLTITHEKGKVVSQGEQHLIFHPSTSLTSEQGQVIRDLRNVNYNLNGIGNQELGIAYDQQNSLLTKGIFKNEAAGGVVQTDYLGRVTTDKAGIYVGSEEHRVEAALQTARRTELDKTVASEITLKDYYYKAVVGKDGKGIEKFIAGKVGQADIDGKANVLAGEQDLVKGKGLLNTLNNQPISLIATPADLSKVTKENITAAQAQDLAKQIGFDGDISSEKGLTNLLKAKDDYDKANSPDKTTLTVQQAEGKTVAQGEQHLIFQPSTSLTSEQGQVIRDLRNVSYDLKGIGKIAIQYDINDFNKVNNYSPADGVLSFDYRGELVKGTLHLSDGTVKSKNSIVEQVYENGKLVIRIDGKKGELTRDAQTGLNLFKAEDGKTYIFDGQKLTPIEGVALNKLNDLQKNYTTWLKDIARTYKNGVSESEDFKKIKEAIVELDKAWWKSTNWENLGTMLQQKKVSEADLAGFLKYVILQNTTLDKDLKDPKTGELNCVAAMKLFYDLANETGIGDRVTAIFVEGLAEPHVAILFKDKDGNASIIDPAQRVTTKDAQGNVVKVDEMITSVADYKPGTAEGKVEIVAIDQNGKLIHLSPAEFEAQKGNLTGVNPVDVYYTELAKRAGSLKEKDGFIAEALKANKGPSDNPDLIAMAIPYFLAKGDQGSAKIYAEQAGKLGVALDPNLAGMIAAISNPSITDIKVDRQGSTISITYTEKNVEKKAVSSESVTSALIPGTKIPGLNGELVKSGEGMNLLIGGQAYQVAGSINNLAVLKPKDGSGFILVNITTGEKQDANQPVASIPAGKIYLGINPQGAITQYLKTANGEKSEVLIQVPTEAGGKLIFLRDGQKNITVIDENGNTPELKGNTVFAFDASGTSYRAAQLGERVTVDVSKAASVEDVMEQLNRGQQGLAKSDGKDPVNINYIKVHDFMSGGNGWLPEEIWNNASSQRIPGPGGGISIQYNGEVRYLHASYVLEHFVPEAGDGKIQLYTNWLNLSKDDRAAIYIDNNGKITFGIIGNQEYTSIVTHAANFSDFMKAGALNDLYNSNEVARVNAVAGAGIALAAVLIPFTVPTTLALSLSYLGLTAAQGISLGQDGMLAHPLVSLAIPAFNVLGGLLSGLNILNILPKPLQAILASEAGIVAVPGNISSKAVQFFLNPTALITSNTSWKSIAGIYTVSAGAKALIGTGAVNLASLIIFHEGLTLNQDVAVFAVLFGSSLLRNVVNGASSRWGAEGFKPGLLNRAINSGVNLAVTFGNVDMAVNNVAYRPAFKDIGTWDAIMFSGKSFIGWKFGDDIKDGEWNKFGGATMGLGLGLAIPLIGGAIAKLGGSKLDYLFNPAYTRYGATMAEVREGGIANVAKWVGQRAVTYGTWTATAVGGSWIATKAHDAIACSEQWGWSWKTAANVVTLAVGARFLASPNWVAQFLTRSGEYGEKGAKEIGTWTGTNALRNATLIIGGAGVNIGKDRLMGNLNTADGKFSPGKLVMSGLQGAFYGKLLSWAASPNGVKYFKGVSENLKNYASPELQPLKSTMLGEIGVKGNGVLQLSIDAYEGALKWPFVSLVMGKASPVWDTLMGAVEKYADHYYGINLEQPTWGWKYDGKTGAFRQQVKDDEYQAITAEEHFSLDRAQLLDYFKSAESGKYMGPIIKIMSKAPGEPVLKNVGKQLSAKGMPRLARYIGGAAEEIVSFKEKTLDHFLQKGLASESIVTRLATGLVKEAGSLTFTAGFVTFIEQALQSVNRAGVYVDIMAGAVNPGYLQTTSGFESRLKEYNNSAFSVAERWGLGWLLLFIKPNIATYATQGRYFSYEANKAMGESVKALNRGDNDAAKVHKERAISLAEQAVKADPNNKNMLGQIKQEAAIAAYNEGVEHAKAGRTNDAEESFSEALSLARESGNKDFVTNMLNILGGDALTRGSELFKNDDKNGAQGHFDKAVTYAEQSGNYGLAAEAHRLRGLTLYEQGQTKQAEEVFSQAVQSAKKAGETKQELLQDIGEQRLIMRAENAFNNDRDYATAARNFDAAAKVAEKAGRPSEINESNAASAHFNEGLNLDRAGKAQEAREPFQKAAEAAGRAGEKGKDILQRSNERLDKLNGILNLAPSNGNGSSASKVEAPKLDAQELRGNNGNGADGMPKVEIPEALKIESESKQSGEVGKKSTEEYISELNVKGVNVYKVENNKGSFVEFRTRDGRILARIPGESINGLTVKNLDKSWGSGIGDVLITISKFENEDYSVSLKKILSDSNGIQGVYIELKKNKDGTELVYDFASPFKGVIIFKSTRNDYQEFYVEELGDTIKVKIIREGHEDVFTFSKIPKAIMEKVWNKIAERDQLQNDPKDGFDPKIGQLSSEISGEMPVIRRSLGISKSSRDVLSHKEPSDVKTPEVQKPDSGNGNGSGPRALGSEVAKVLGSDGEMYSMPGRGKDDLARQIEDNLNKELRLPAGVPEPTNEGLPTAEQARFTGLSAEGNQADQLWQTRDNLVAQTAERGKDEVRNLYRKDGETEGRLKGPAQERFIEHLSEYWTRFTERVDQGKMYIAAIAAGLSIGKNTAAQFVINRFVKDGAPAGTKGVVVWFGSEGELRDTAQQARAKLGTVGRENEVTELYSERDGSLVEINPKNGERVKVDINEIKDRKGLILVHDENLKFWAGGEWDVFEALVKGRIISMPDFQKLAGLQMSMQEAIGKSAPEIIALVKEYRAWLKELLGNQKESVLEKGEYAIGRDMEIATAEGKREEVKILWLSEAVRKKFLEKNKAESFEELSHRKGGKEAIAALLAAAEGMAGIDGVDYYRDLDTNEVIPLSDHNGQANRVHDSNSYRSVGKALSVAQRCLEEGYLSKEAAEKMSSNVSFQNRGMLITTAESVYRLNKAGAKSLLLLTGALTKQQQRLLKAEYDPDVINEIPVPIIDRDFKKAGKIVGTSVAADSYMATAVEGALSRAMNIVIIDVGKDTGKGSKGWSVKREAVLSAAGEQGAEVMICREPDGKYRLLRSGDNPKSAGEQIKIENISALKNEFAEKGFETENATSEISLINALLNSTGKEGKVVILISRPYATGTDLLVETVKRSPSTVLESVGDKKSSLWFAFQSLSRLRPPNEDFSNVERRFVMTGMDTLGSKPDAKKTQRQIFKLLWENQKIDDAQEIYTTGHEAISEIGHKFNNEMVDALKEAHPALAEAIRNENKKHQEINSVQEMQNAESKTNISSTVLNDMAVREKEWSRQNWSPEGKWFKDLENVQSLELREALKQKVLETWFSDSSSAHDRPLFDCLGVDQITSRMRGFEVGEDGNPRGFETSDYPTFASRPAGNRFRLKDAAEDTAVPVENLLEQYPRLTGKIESIRGFTDRGFVGFDGAGMFELQKIMGSREMDERPALNNILARAGLSQLPNGPLTEDQALDALAGLIKTGRIDLANPQRSVASVILAGQSEGFLGVTLTTEELKKAQESPEALAISYAIADKAEISGVNVEQAQTVKQWIADDTTGFRPAYKKRIERQREAYRKGELEEEMRFTDSEFSGHLPDLRQIERDWNTFKAMGLVSPEGADILKSRVAAYQKHLKSTKDLTLAKVIERDPAEIFEEYGVNNDSAIARTLANFNYARNNLQAMAGLWDLEQKADEAAAARVQKAIGASSLEDAQAKLKRIQAMAKALAKESPELVKTKGVSSVSGIREILGTTWAEEEGLVTVSEDGKTRELTAKGDIIFEVALGFGAIQDTDRNEVAEAKTIFGLINKLMEGKYKVEKKDNLTKQEKLNRQIFEHMNKLEELPLSQMAKHPEHVAVLEGERQIERLDPSTGRYIPVSQRLAQLEERDTGIENTLKELDKLGKKINSPDSIQGDDLLSKGFRFISQRFKEKAEQEEKEGNPALREALERIAEGKAVVTFDRETDEDMGKTNMNRAAILTQDPSPEEKAVGITHKYIIQIRDSNFNNQGNIKASPLLYDVNHELKHGVYAIARGTSTVAQEGDAQIDAVEDVQNFVEDKTNSGIIDLEDYHFIIDSNLGNPKERREAEVAQPEAKHDTQFYIKRKVARDLRINAIKEAVEEKAGQMFELRRAYSQRDLGIQIAGAGYFDPHKVAGFCDERRPAKDNKRAIYFKIDGSNGTKLVVSIHELIHALAEVYQDNPKEGGLEDFLNELSAVINATGDLHLKQAFDKVIGHIRYYGVSGAPLSRSAFKEAGVDIKDYLVGLIGRLEKQNSRHVGETEKGVRKAALDKARELLKKLAKEGAAAITDADFFELYSIMKKFQQTDFGVMSELLAYIGPILAGETVAKEGRKFTDTNVVRFAELVQANPKLRQLFDRYFEAIGLPMVWLNEVELEAEKQIASMDAGNLFNQGVTALKQNNIEDAFDYFRQVIEKDKGGELAQKAQKIIDEINDHKQAVEKAVEFFEQGSAEIKGENPNLQSAKEYFEKARDLVPGSGLAKDAQKNIDTINRLLVPGQALPAIEFKDKNGKVIVEVIPTTGENGAINYPDSVRGADGLEYKVKVEVDKISLVPIEAAGNEGGKELTSDEMAAKFAEELSKLNLSREEFNEYLNWLNAPESVKEQHKDIGRMEEITGIISRVYDQLKPKSDEVIIKGEEDVAGTKAKDEPILADQILGTFRMNGSGELRAELKNNNLVLVGNGRAGNSVAVTIPKKLAETKDGYPLKASYYFGIKEDYTVRFLNGGRSQWLITQDSPNSSEIIARFDQPNTSSPLAYSKEEVLGKVVEAVLREGGIGASSGVVKEEAGGLSRINDGLDARASSSGAVLIQTEAELLKRLPPLQLLLSSYTPSLLGETTIPNTINMMPIEITKVLNAIFSLVKTSPINIEETNTTDKFSAQVASASLLPELKNLISAIDETLTRRNGNVKGILGEALKVLAGVVEEVARLVGALVGARGEERKAEGSSPLEKRLPMAQPPLVGSVISGLGRIEQAQGLIIGKRVASPISLFDARDAENRGRLAAKSPVLRLTTGLAPPQRSPNDSRSELIGGSNYTGAQAVEVVTNELNSLANVLGSLAGAQSATFGNEERGQGARSAFSNNIGNPAQEAGRDLGAVVRFYTEAKAIGSETAITSDAISAPALNAEKTGISSSVTSNPLEKTESGLFVSEVSASSPAFNLGGEDLIKAWDNLWRLKAQILYRKRITKSAALKPLHKAAYIYYKDELEYSGEDAWMAADAFMARRYIINKIKGEVHLEPKKNKEESEAILKAMVEKDLSNGTLKGVNLEVLENNFNEGLSAFMRLFRVSPELKDSFLGRIEKDEDSLRQEVEIIEKREKEEEALAKANGNGIDLAVADALNKLSKKIDEQKEVLGGKIDEQKEVLGGKIDEQKEVLGGKIDEQK
ncbi:MAG: hypothetical protein Q7K98_03405, partial [Candidatus Omnitrophota bacterium]|nr:hypothetical protein [Candidatus Omnitrophota bacterium]